jgi:hypothetical protein
MRILEYFQRHLLHTTKLRIKLPPIKSWDFMLSSVKIRIDSPRDLNDD